MARRERRRRSRDAVAADRLRDCQASRTEAATRVRHRSRSPTASCAARALEADDLDALVITGPGSVRWLTGYGGSNGLCIVTPTEQRFLTDFRYGAGVAHLRDSWDVQVVDQNLIGVLAERRCRRCSAMRGASASRRPG